VGSCTATCARWMPWLSTCNDEGNWGVAVHV